MSKNESLQKLKQKLKQDPRDFNLRIQYSNALRRKGKNKEAFQLFDVHYTKGLELWTKSFELWASNLEGLHRFENSLAWRGKPIDIPVLQKLVNADIEILDAAKISKNFPRKQDGSLYMNQTRILRVYQATEINRYGPSNRRLVLKASTPWKTPEEVEDRSIWVELVIRSTKGKHLSEEQWSTKFHS